MTGERARGVTAPGRAAPAEAETTEAATVDSTTAAAATSVRWPRWARPDSAPVHTYNEIETDAPAEAVWAWLIRAARWPQWYPHCKRMVIEPADGDHGPALDLAPESRFHWTTLGVRVHTVVEEFEPLARLAWSGRAPAGHGYHAWVIEPRARGCRVITEEVQRGALPWVGRWYLRRALHRAHQRWLEELVARARSGLPA